MKRQLFFIIACTHFLFSCSNSEIQTNKQYVVVLSMDGFRWDYPDKASTPNLDFIAANGVKAERLIPCFPTKTFPNHYSIATGLYIDNHGIVLNNFHSPEFGQDYNKGNRASVEDGKFYDGEPIWVTAEKQGVRTASYFWVGSEADIDGISPTYQKMYDHKFPYSQRIDSVIFWLSLPEAQRPQLIMWYMDEPDWSGHRFGPEGDDLKPVISRMDSLVGVFMKAMLELPHASQINFIVLSDHGMAQLSPERRVILDQYVDTAKIAIIDGWNPNFNLKVKEGYLEEVYDSLRKIEHLHVWKSSEVPERMHYGKHPRTHDLVIVAENNWSVYWSWAIGNETGAHGFDNEFTDMHAIFYAMGPGFKKGYHSEPIPNIDIYPLLAKLLNIQPAPVDGNLDRVNKMLKN
ncbi:MAG: ectonucleotide pyrophosphatase/phosphodiesterase [Bacteroidales bacterium]|nr:ectonucleotide pyrophosphatase/phosphodiesterase [Bacteroidales bacterium]